MVIHVAGILPSAFNADPLTGAAVNLGGALELMRESVAKGVKRFIFASSMSVYGSAHNRRPLTEEDPAIPDEGYGAAKRAIELIGETLSKKGALEFAALRIARVIGPGIKNTASPWRSQLFEAPPQSESIRIPFSPDAVLSLVHVEDVARMLFILARAPALKSFVYNAPAEIFEAKHLKELIELSGGPRVELVPDATHGGPVCDGSRFAREFDFELRGVADRLTDCTTNTQG
jgi:UDP-glucose 4-epimerase